MKCYLCVGLWLVQLSLVVADVQSDLKKSLAELTAFRQSVAEQKIELSKRMTETQAKLLEKRRQVRLLRMGTVERREAIAELERKVAAAEKEQNYQQGQLKNFVTKYHVSTVGAVVNETEPLEMLNVALKDAQKKVGGRVFDAEVVDLEGAMVAGKLVQFGPLLWFVDASGKLAGSAHHELSSGVVRLVSEVNVSEVESLIQGEEVSPQIDLSGGSARALAEIQGSPWQMIRKGGFWVLPILFLALISIVCSIFKFIQLSKIQSPPSGWMHSLLDAVRGGDEAEIQRACKVAHPVSSVLGDALKSVQYGAEMVEEVVYEKLIDVRSKMRSWLVFIGTTASIAPLLGLLGTVSGMITTFNVISVVGTGDAKPMAGGISEALVTTLFGLIVAIPSLILFALLSRKSKGIVQMTEKLSLTVVNDIRKRVK